MKTILFAAWGILWTCTLVLGQSVTSAATDEKNARTDAKTLQALLDEVHRLRQDLQTTSATVQRAQILLYRLRLQIEAVERASQNLEQAKAAAAQIRSARQYFAERTKQQEQFLEQTSDPETRKRIEAQIESMKDQFAQFENQEPEAQAKETECMSGYHSVVVIAEAVQKSFQGIDLAGAHATMKRQATVSDYQGLPLYRKYGYIPCDLVAESVGKSMDYAYDDWAMAHVARAAGAEDEARGTRPNGRDL